MTTSLPPVASTQVAASGKAAGASSSGAGIFSNLAGGMDFWTMILSGLNADVSGGQQETNTAQSAGSLFSSQKNPLASLQVALAGQNGNILLTSAQTTEQLQGQLDLTNQVINFLKNMTPETSGKDGVMNKLLSKLQTTSDSLQASLSALQGTAETTITKDTNVDDIPMPMLIALGLAPSEISAVSDQIRSIEEKLGRDVTVEDLIAGISGLIPPAQTAAVAAPGLKSSGTDPLSLDGSSSPGDLQAQLNALTADTGGSDDGTDTESMQGIAGGKKSRGIEIPADLAATSNNAGNAEKYALTETDVKKAFESFKQHLTAVANTNNTQTGDMIFPVSLFNGDIDSSLLPAGGSALASSLPFSSAAQAASASVAQPSAGASHPAVQSVAATITRTAQSGSEDVMNVRLDPPELGAVSIRLQFGKDKTVKAHLTVEKSETYTMLQRDGQALERALQEAGLDAGDGSISFELAQDNHFGNDNNGQGGGESSFGKANKLSDQDDPGEVIQTTVNWAIDPATGQIRYNLLV